MPASAVTTKHVQQNGRTLLCIFNWLKCVRCQGLELSYLLSVASFFFSWISIQGSVLVLGCVGLFWKEANCSQGGGSQGIVVGNGMQLEKKQFYKNPLAHHKEKLREENTFLSFHFSTPLSQGKCLNSKYQMKELREGQHLLCLAACCVVQ